MRDSYLAGERAVCEEEGTSTEVLAEAERDFVAFVERRRRPRELWGVPVTELWYVDGPEYIGTVILRHRLSPELEVEGGHVGYHVVPGHRRRGHATRMLAQTRAIAAGLGLPMLLITCADDNIASRRVIDRNGGILVMVEGGTARYELSTSDDSQSTRPHR